jgi:AhpD family alkylhydroperoxidase
MDRPQVYKQIESLFGFVPQFFKLIPDATLDLEWQLMQRVQMDPGPIPNKYRELIGVGIAATTKCAYCIYFHTEMAKLNGATQAEIEDAVHFAKSSAGWSTYLNGMQLDQAQFRAEVRRACEYVHAMQAQPVPPPKVESKHHA